MQVVAKTKEQSDTEGPVRADPVEERLRLNLIKFIGESGYSDVQVADLAGITQASLSRYKRGENAVASDALKRLAELFGRSTEDFYQREPPKPLPREEAVARTPMFLRARPEVQLTEEDLSDFEEFLEKVRGRREKKKGKK